MNNQKKSHVANNNIQCERGLTSMYGGHQLLCFAFSEIQLCRESMNQFLAYMQFEYKK